jgi:hypothetical protein
MSYDIIIPGGDEQVSFREHPEMLFYWKEVAGKRRLIGHPNNAMRRLHAAFGRHLLSVIYDKKWHAGYAIRKLESATGCVKHSNPTINAQGHIRGRFFYITDLKDAYPRVNLTSLALFLTYLFRKEGNVEVSIKFFSMDPNRAQLFHDPLFPRMLGFLRVYFSGQHGEGIAVGGPLSPYLMNLYCEVFLDVHLRRVCEMKDITYTRYDDDLVFSSSRPIWSHTRADIRSCIANAVYAVNHQKSKVLALSMGAVFITKVGLALTEDGGVRLVFPQKKRRRLHQAIQKYLCQESDWPEKVSGLIAEFLYYYKNVLVKTASDRKTLALCKRFEAEWAKYREGPHPAALRSLHKNK